MKNFVTKGTYCSPKLRVLEFNEKDAICTSIGAEVDYQEQGWGSSGLGFDKPFED